MTSQIAPFKIRGRSVRIDELGRVSLNDIHVAGGFTTNQKPSDWGSLETTLRQIAFTAAKSSGNSGTLSKKQTISVYCVKMGRNGGIWAHPNLALAYAKYLSPALHYEVNEVFLRYKSGDATLADETLQRSTPEGNEWAAKRAMGRVVRNQYTQELDKRGVLEGYQYGICTNETYLGLFDKKAAELKKERGLKDNANLRDTMSMKEIAFIAASEALSVEHMEEEESLGFKACRSATASAAQALRSAIETSRRSRQGRLP